MRESTTSTPITVTTFTHEPTGRQLAAMWEIETAAGKRWVAEVHDFNGENGDGPQYDPISLGVFADDDQAREEINDHVSKYSGL